MNYKQMTQKDKKQKHANTKFVELAQQRFKEWARIKGLECSVDNFLLFMLKHSLLREKVINRYLVTQLYKEYRAEGTRSEQCIYQVSDIVPYERTNIYDILKNYSNHFNENKLTLK